MARGPRISFPGAVFHLINRFVDRHPFFRDDEDYDVFLDIYFRVAETFNVRTFAYDLLPNHFHFVIQTENGNLSNFLQRFQCLAAHALNRKRERTGHVFQGRAKTLLVETDRYFETVMGYVLTNRVRAGLAPSVFADARNSVAEMLSPAGSRIDRENLWPLLFQESFSAGGRSQRMAKCRKWLRGLDARLLDKSFRDAHRGAFLSTVEFRKGLLSRFERRNEEFEKALRRKIDRRARAVSIEDMRKAALRAVAEERRPGTWRDSQNAVEHICWHLAFTVAGWPLERIRTEFCEPGAAHSRVTMALSRIRLDPKRQALAAKAEELL